MKPDFMDEYQRPPVFGVANQPLSYTALQGSLLKASSMKDLRDRTLITQTQPRNGRVPSPFRKFSETFKRRGFAKSSVTTMKQRNGSISSDSGEGSLSDAQSTTNEPEKCVLRNSEQSCQSQSRKYSAQDIQEKTVGKKPQHLTFRQPRRFSSPATSPTRKTFGESFPAATALPLKSNLKDRSNRRRGLSLPDALVGGVNRITTRNIRDSGAFGIGCLEEDEEEGQYGNDVRKCLDLTRPLSKHAKSSVLLISDQNSNELEFIELNKLLDKETLQASAAIPDEEGMTILHRAVQNGFLNLTKFLVNSGVSTEMTDLQGRTALCLALERGNYDCAELLLRLGANVNFAMKGGKTILHQMAQEGDYKAVQLLVKHGADLNMEDDKGWPALHYALKRKDLKCAALLMTSGVNIHRYTEKRIQEFSMSMEIVNIGKVRLDNSKTVDHDLEPEVTII
ncbi:hypothetical protein ACROYT_G005463 [Oculina patagonica]